MKNIYLLNLIKENRHKFSSTESALSKFITSVDDSEMISLSITELANRSSVSQTTVYNFVKKLGFEGFQDFKIKIAANQNDSTPKKSLSAYGDITSTDSPQHVAEKIINSNQTALESLKYYLDSATLESSLEKILKSNSLTFFGQGGSTVVAYDAYHKFLRSSFHCNYIADYHMQISYATKLNSSDCAFLFSHSGETKETIHLARLLRDNGVSIISMTGNPNSPLVEFSDSIFVIHSDESKFRTESLTSRILYLTVLDILYTLVMYSDEDSNYDALEQIRKVLNSRRI